MMSDKKVLTTGEIAKYCGVNFRTVIRWVERGHIKAFKLPGRGDNRIEIPDFLDFLKKNNMPIPEDFQQEVKNLSRKVLVVDDMKTTTELIRRTLLKEGYEVEVAHDGFSAGALVGTFSPALMTLDLKMPGMDGFEVLTYVREKLGLGNLKILVISSLSKKKLQQALDMGADAVLEKPFKAKELIEIVNILLE